MTDSTIGDTDFPTPAAIIEVHDTIEDEYDIKYTGARVAAPRLELREILEDVNEFDGVYFRAAALLRGLITAHIFEDGNKRTARAVTVLYLEEHNLKPADRDETVERVLRRIGRFDMLELAEWLETGDIDEELRARVRRVIDEERELFDALDT